MGSELRMEEKGGGRQEEIKIETKITGEGGELNLQNR